TTLTPQNVNASSFGKLFSYTVDGFVYAQPLEVSQLRMGDGQLHNVLFVATENDSVYALDANDPTAGPRHNGVLWQDSFIDPAHGVTPVPFQDVETGDIRPVLGITGTPVIDRSTDTLYVVTRVKEQPQGGGGPHYITQFHALNLTNGREKNGGPVTVGDTTLNADGSFTNKTPISVPGTGAGSANGVVAFNALRENNRAGLVLDMNVPGHPDGVVFAGFGSQSDFDSYHGWIVGFDAKTLKIVTLFNTDPNGGFGAVWQAGAAPAVASNGDLIFATGNGTFDAFTTTTPPGPAAQGEAGFGLGYADIGQSVGVTFGAAIPSTGVSSTGLFHGGVYPTEKPVAPDVFQPLKGTGIDFTTGSEDPNGPHTFQATLSYHGTTLSETITDQTTGASFSRDYANVDLPTSVGGGTAFVGFGAGTDGRVATIALDSWTYSSGGQTLIDHAGGFASNGDLTATGITTFNGAAADLTNLAIGNGGGQQAGNLFANARVNIQDFSTTFTFQMQPDTGSDPSPLGDGLTFIIQNDTGHRPGPDFGESVLRVSPTPGTMTVVDSFTPFDFKNRDNLDLDTGSGSVTLLPDFPGTAHPHEAVTADKSGRLYLVDVDNMGGFNPGGPDRVLQEFIANPHGLIYSSPVFFDGKIYIQGAGDVIKAFALKLDPATNTMLLDETPVSQGTMVSGFPGEVQSISADGTSNGIVWSPQVDAFASGGPAILRAYDANDLSTPLYSSNQAGPRDTAGGGVKFTTPTIANGMVYLGTQFEVDVYGLLSQSPGQAQQGNVLQTNLVSDLPGVAAVTDPHLVNPWGISESATSPFWISDNNAGVSTLYNTPGQNGAPIAINPLVVSIPTPPNPLDPVGAPTGTVFDTSTGGFQVSGFSKTGAAASASAVFLFATEDGTIVGWNPWVNPKGFAPAKAGTYGIIAVNNSGNNFINPNPLKQTGAVYKGMSIATSASPIFAGDANSTSVIYAANFRSGKIQVYDANFKAVTLPAGAFTDAMLPDGFAPFDVQLLNGKVYVTYAKQNAAKHDDVAGQGNGFVDVFNLDGTLGLAGGKVRLITRGQLNSPWGLAIAPVGFAAIRAPHNDPVLLVGNFGDGLIHAYDAFTGQFLTQLKDPDGEPIQINKLWTLKVGNGGAGGDANTVYFTAGIFNETHGLFGSLTTAAPGSPEGPAEAQMIQADLDVTQLDLQAVLNDISSGASAAMLQQDIQALNAALAQLGQDETRFAADTQDDHSPAAALRAATQRRAMVKALQAESRSLASAHHAAVQGFDLSTLDKVFAGLGKLL
ncbi:MAG TPA: TIGR03118 family protein, partial [Gemmataceae bacterium]|nr:TIGR03118 family protein [Gemmataceae bacterium]